MSPEHSSFISPLPTANSRPLMASLSWSGGKDSAFALYKAMQSQEVELVSLHTVISADTGRVGLHGVPVHLIQEQAEQIGLPLQILKLESSGEHGNYEALMRSYYEGCCQSGIDAIIFGDIFLEDLKKYREELLRPFGLQPIFPLWKMDTYEMMGSFLGSGFKTLICAADTKYFSGSHLGKTIDDAFLRALPAGVDPCGENGEFHTFVYEGPIFKRPLSPALGFVVKKDYTFKRALDDKTVETVTSSFLFQSLE